MAKGDRPSIIGGTTYNHQKSLRYGDKDASLTGDVRKTVEAFENQRYKNKIEFVRIVDADGNVIQEKKGGKGNVSFSAGALNSGFVLTHNHPRTPGSGILGGTFSDADLNNFVRYNASITRATAAEGTYSISKGANFNGAGFKNYYNDEYKRIQEKWSAKTKAYRNSKAEQLKKARTNSDWKTYSKISKQLTDYGNTAFNSQLVEMHNALLAGQKKYGYSYTLERR